jgi:tripartite-type tricarboxylate transporter receptor subunit TctC
MRLLLAVTAALCTLLPGAVAAQDVYPSKQITLLSGFPPGGSVDLTSRALAPVLQKIVGQPIVIQSKPGAAAAIGTQAVAIAPPDGYTLTLATTQISVLPAVDQVFGRKPAFTREDFVPIARISADPSMIWANAEQSWKTFKEFVEDAKKRDGQIVYASGGLYGATHLPIEMIAKAAGIKMRHLPTAGGGPALTAVLGNNAALLAAHPGVAGPHAKSGKLTPLASMGAKRHPEWPDVPTLKELGLDVEYYQWIGLFGQAKLPEPIVKTLRDAIVKAVADPEFIAAMAKAGAGIDHQDQADFAAWWKKDSDILESVVKAIGKVE